MEREEFLEYLRRGNPVTGRSEMHLLMHELAAEALKETAELNGSYHEPEEMRRLFSKIIGKPVDDSFSMFPPFYTECGKNIYLGKNVFINCGCHFQDHGVQIASLNGHLCHIWRPACDLNGGQPRTH